MTLASALVLLMLHDVSPPWAPGGVSQGEDLAVSLVTFGPGDELPTLWGHSALMIVDRKRREGRLYNYGEVDFSPGFAGRFLAGRLEFHVGDAPIEPSFAAYRALDRDVRVQELNLTPEQSLQIANALAVNVLPQNRGYLYHHYNENCSTRPRDLLDRALGGALTGAASGPARMSLRDHTRRYSRYCVPFALWLDYVQNDQVDRPITQREEVFLPDELERQLDALTVDGHPLVKHKTTLYQSKLMAAPPALTPRWEPWLALASLLSGAAVLALRRSATRLARIALGALLALEGLVWGLNGVALFLLGAFTNNQVTHHNENLFFINPLTLALLPLGLLFTTGRAVRGLKWVTLALAALGVVGVVLKVLPSFQQQNGSIIALVLPLSLASAVAFFRPRPASA